jgi:hypothetical protein
MDRGFAASLSPTWMRAATIGLAVLFALFVWLVISTSAFISFTVAVVAAAAWCIWLQRVASDHDP